MEARYYHKGETLDYVNDTDSVIEANTVKPIGDHRIGVIGGTIKPGETGSIHVGGVFICPKDTGAITFGQKVFYDTAKDKIVGASGESTVPAGYATTKATENDTTVTVSIG